MTSTSYARGNIGKVQVSTNPPNPRREIKAKGAKTMGHLRIVKPVKEPTARVVWGRVTVLECGHCEGGWPTGVDVSVRDEHGNALCVDCANKIEPGIGDLVEALDQAVGAVLLAPANKHDRFIELSKICLQMLERNINA